MRSNVGLVSRKLTGRRLTPSEAMDLWNDSDQASAFTRPDHLARLVDEIEWWGVERSGRIVAAWPLVRATAGGRIEPPAFCYYLGPMFSRTLLDGKYPRSWSAHVDVFSELVTAVVAAHPRFRFSMPLGLTDLRVLEWWNFDHPNEIGFTFRPRYTARVELSAVGNDDTFLMFGSNRRRAIRSWSASPPILVNNVRTDRLIQLHDGALRGTGGETGASRRTALERMIALVQSGAGSVLGFQPRGQDEVAAAIILLDGPTESNAIFYGADKTWRDRGLIAWAVWQGMQRARDAGKRWFDFNGANSPGRAADKHFYGGRTELHFECHFGPA